MAVINKRALIENYFHIVDKENKDTILKFNEGQEELYQVIKDYRKEHPTGKLLILILKARQLGMSTFTEALGCAECLTKENQTMLIMTHRASSTDQLYRMTQNYVTRLPEALKPSIKKFNENMIWFDNEQGTGLNSKIFVMTASANSKGVGRGYTFSFLHLSEFDYWEGSPLEVLASLQESLSHNATVIIETTANGCRQFKQLWDRAVAGNDYNKWIPLFFPWWGAKEYMIPEQDYIKGTKLDLDNEEREIVRLIKTKYVDISEDDINRKLLWRRYKIESNNGDINMFHQENPSTPEEAFISSGECIFNLNQLVTRKNELIDKGCAIYDKGHFTYEIEFDIENRERRIGKIQWVHDTRDEWITLFKNVEKRRPYVGCIDPSGTGIDFSACNVLDNISGEQVALLHVNKISSFELACQCYCLGKYYNNMLLSSEVNYAPEVVQYLKEMQYPKLYIQENNEGIGIQIIKKYGVRTTTVTRPKFIDSLKNYFYEYCNLVNSVETLIEAQNFVRVTKDDGKTWKVEANKGAHDDIIMSLGMTLYIRESGQQEFHLLPDEEAEETKVDETYLRMFGRPETETRESEDYVYYDD